MFNNVSMTGTGLIILIVENLLRLMGIEFPEGSVASAMNGLLAIIGLLAVVWGQLRRKDLKAGFVRKIPRV